MAKSWEQILGGYATDTLTAAEKRKLFEAALYDQDLFDALADEEALKVLLSDPKARQRILESLKASLEPQWIASSHPSWFKWFRKPSSLAWVGGMAAAGLALIFGWQMNTDWGSIVQQQTEIEQSELNKKESDANEDAGLSQPTPSPLEEKKLTAKFRKKDESLLPKSVRPQASVPPLSEVSSEIAKSFDGLRQDQDTVKRERREQDGGLDSLSSEIQERVAGDSESTPVQEKLPLEPAVQPLVMLDEEKMERPADAKLAPAPEPVVVQAQKQESLPPPGALDRFYAGVGARDLGRKGKAGAGHTSRKQASKKSSSFKAKKKNRESKQAPVETDEAVIQKATGIRYSFMREVGGEVLEFARWEQITGDWSDVRIAIEPNEAGFVYVLAPVGRGTWRLLKETREADRQAKQDGIAVKAYQTVDFQLGVYTNVLGKLVISSLRVFYSPTPVENFSGGGAGPDNVNMAKLQIERTDDSVYVVRSEGVSDDWLRVDIDFEEK